MGESFDLFGGDDDKAVTVSASTKEESVAKSTEALNQTLAGARTNAISSNQFASSATTNSYNVITARPTSRVLQEPGGKSEDFIFG